jgi:hypothetical protein
MREDYRSNVSNHRLWGLLVRMGAVSDCLGFALEISWVENEWDWVLR